MLCTLVFLGQSSVQWLALEHIIQGYWIRILTNFTNYVFVFAISFVDLIMVVGTTKPLFSNYDKSSK
jgi:hypothetical protein